MKVINVFQAMARKTKGEAIDYKTNKTVPSQSMTIREILTRFASGGTMDAMSHPVHYDGDDSVVNEDHVDSTLRPDYDLSDMSSEMREIEDREKQRKSELEKRKADKALKAKQLEREQIKKELMEEAKRTIEIPNNPE